MAKQESKMHLPTIDDLFTTQEERDNANLEKVVDIKIADIVYPGGGHSRGWPLLLAGHSGSDGHLQRYQQAGI